MESTADPPGVYTRLIRGTELHRRYGSRYSPAAQLPPRAMMLEQVHPWDRTVHEPADIEPYLMDLSDDDVQRFAEADRREVDPPVQVEMAAWQRFGSVGTS